ncbi:unnamed protein product [Durusdinium trenchii]|uniref:FHA domain-containing protein n=1 Tax=Durusdinium trenchii TaxID=1381693 RepID=A0ABP0IBL5_9DINO
MGDKFLATLSFDAASGRPPLQFVLGPEKKAITVGRAPKSDVVCTLSGISWNHLELRLPQAPASGYLLVKDLSMNGTGLRLTPSQPIQKVPKESELQLPNGGAISVPVRKPKKKEAEEHDVIQQSFVLKLEPYSGELPQKRLAEPAGNIPKKRATDTGMTSQLLPESCTQRLAKGEALVKSARQAESRGRLNEAFPAYRRGLQHLIRVLPFLDAWVSKNTCIARD